MKAFEAYAAGQDNYQTEAVRQYKMIQRWQKSVMDVFGVQPIIFGVDQNVHPTPTSCDVLNKWNLSCTNEPRYPHFTNGNRARNGGRPVAVDAKHWYASYFLDQGKAVLFSDVDLVFYRNGELSSMLARDCAFYPTIRLQMINLCFHLALVYGPHIQRKKRKFLRFRTYWARRKKTH